MKLIIIFMLIAFNVHAKGVRVLFTDDVRVSVNDKGGVDFYNILGNPDKGNVKVAEFVSALEKAKEWTKQAKESNAPEFHKEIKHWKKGDITIIFAHYTKSDYINICVRYYKSGKATCGATPTEYIDEYLQAIKEAPEKIKLEMDTASKFK